MQPVNPDLIVRGATVTHRGTTSVCDLWVRGGRVERLEPSISLPPGASPREIDAAGLWLLPGVIDSHVHFRDPGFPAKGTMHSESRAAVAGGVTTVFDMPNTLPPTMDVDAWTDKMRRARQRMWTNYAFYAGVHVERWQDALAIDPTQIPGYTDDGLYMSGARCLALQPPRSARKSAARGSQNACAALRRRGPHSGPAARGPARCSARSCRCAFTAKSATRRPA